MTAIANIVLLDAASTPVSHTFNPSRQGLSANGLSVADYEDRVANGGVPVGFYKITSSFSRPSKQRPDTYRIALKLETPVMEVLSNSTVDGIMPAPTVAYSPIISIDVVLPSRSSLQIRKDIRKMAYQLLNDASIVAMIEQLDAPI